jgi:hypothetical protein
MAVLAVDANRARATGARGRARAQSALREQGYHATVAAAILEDFRLTP